MSKCISEEMISDECHCHCLLRPLSRSTGQKKSTLPGRQTTERDSAVRLSCEAHAEAQNEILLSSLG